MATISACTSTSSIAPVALLQKPSAVKPFAILGLLQSSYFHFFNDNLSNVDQPIVNLNKRPNSYKTPSMTKNVCKVKCSMEGKPQESDFKLGTGASSVIAAACAAAMSMSNPSAMALVEERMSTEGTWLPFGFSNNLLVCLILGMFSLIWSLYFVYTASLEEDEESGLSL